MKPILWLLMAVGSPGSAWAEAPVSHLMPEQIQVIRTVGQAVLAAKKVKATDPALAGLRQGIADARAMVDTELALPASVQGRAELKPMTPPSSPAAEVTAQALAERTMNRLETAHTKVARITARREQAMAAAREQPAPARAQMVAEAAEHLQTLEQELDTALTEPDETRIGHLAQIRQRLTPKRMREIQVENPGPGLQPTIVTLTEHVVPVDTPSNAKPGQVPATPHRLKVVKPKARNQGQ